MKNSNFLWNEKIADEFKKINIYHIVAYVIYFAISATLSKLAGWLFSLSFVNQIILFLFLIVILVLFFITKLIWPSRDRIQPLPLGREKEIRRLVDEIKSGQSSIIVGIFGNERTAILDYLRNSDRVNLYGKKQADQLIFSFLDMTVQSSDNFDHSKFWEQVLIPVYQTMTNEEKIAYDNSKQAGFDNFSLNQLFQQMKQKGQRLVLMIDRFHRIAEIDGLNKPSFFASLRMLASHANGPLSLILTIGESEQLSQLRTREPGKLYEFNFFNEITLGALTEEHFDKLLTESGVKVKEERQWIKECTSGHPYLLGKVVAFVKKASLGKFSFFSPFSTNRLEATLKAQLLEEILERELLRGNLSVHTNMCEALFSVVEEKADITHFSALDELRKQGFLEKSNEQWMVRSRVMADFLKERQKKLNCVGSVEVK